MSMRNVSLFVAVAVIACGCASVTPTAPVLTGPTASDTASMLVSRSPNPMTTQPIVVPTPTLAATQSEPVDLEVSQTPTFVGDGVTLTVTSSVTGGPTNLLIASASIDFGDRTSGTATGSCTARVSIDHVYWKAGDYEPRVTAVSACDPTVVTDVSGANARVHLFPAASTASASWPVCTTFQLHLDGPWTGAGLGNVAARITLRNVGAHGCTLEGYPGLALVAADGSLLPTHVRPAITGAYMFPAVVPHRVALAPGEVASFMIGYTDNPFGPAASEPYDVACPPSVAVRVILPGTHQFGTATVAMGVCGGVVEVSPIVPGANGLQFS